MEWTWRQQLYMLLQSGGVGFLLGIVYDLLVTAGRVQRLTRSVVFILDALFGAMAALVTFYFSLAIMDGRLHPLLFAGIFIGFAVEHASVSRLLCRALYCSGVLLKKALDRLKETVGVLSGGLITWFGRFFRWQKDKCSMNCEKKAKKFNFFQKNS